MNLDPLLETRRLVLRQPQLSDAEAIFQRYARHPEVTHYLSWPAHLSVRETRQFLLDQSESIARGEQAAWVVVERPERLPCGMVGLMLDVPEARFGYCLAESVWGRGLATEAAAAVLPQVWKLQGMQQVVAYCHPKHDRSARVLEKLGFVSSGPVRRKTVLPAMGPGRQDMLRYVLRRPTDG